MITTALPQLQDFHLEGVKHISPADAYEALQNNSAIMIDVREQYEVNTENIPLENVLNHPLSVIMDRLPLIAKDQDIIISCTLGLRSTKVANMLNLQGYPNVANLDGGNFAWKAQGFPIQGNLNFNVGCGCGCGSKSMEDSIGSCC